MRVEVFRTLEHAVRVANTVVAGNIGNIALDVFGVSLWSRQFLERSLMHTLLVLRSM